LFGVNIKKKYERGVTNRVRTDKAVTIEKIYKPLTTLGSHPLFGVGWEFLIENGVNGAVRGRLDRYFTVNSTPIAKIHHIKKKVTTARDH